MRRTYKIENPPLPLVPPVVDARGIENDPLLGSFFQDTKEDQPPLEVSGRLIVVGFIKWVVVNIRQKMIPNWWKFPFFWYNLHH